jgi:hypothetical protein
MVNPMNEKPKGEPMAGEAETLDKLYAMRLE